MQISGIGDGQDTRPVMMPQQGTNNPELDSLQRQIEEKQKQLQELGKDDKLSPEQKQKKRQSLEQEIAELEAQKNQVKMAAKQKERKEAEERQAKQNGESYNRNKDGDTSQISARGMKALITAGAAMDMADVKNRVATSLEGEAGVLESEIKLDQGRGGDTTKKEKQLGEINAKADDLNRKTLDDLDKANEEMRFARDRERERKEDKESMQKEENGFAAGVQPDERKTTAAASSQSE